MHAPGLDHGKMHLSGEITRHKVLSFEDSA